MTAAAARRAARFAALRTARRVGMKVGGAGGRRTRRGRTRFARKVRRVLLKTTESCYKSIEIPGADGGGLSGCNHNTLKNYVIWGGSANFYSLFPSQGLSDGERIGDEIYVTGIMLRATFQIPADRRNTRFKLWLVPHSDKQGDPANYPSFFHNITGNGFLDPIQTDRWKGIKYLGMYKCSSVDQEPAEDKTVMVKKWIPIYRKVTFQSDGSQVIASGLDENCYLSVLPYDTVTTLVTDTVITRVEASATLYYKCP